MTRGNQENKKDRQRETDRNTETQREKQATYWPHRDPAPVLSPPPRWFTLSLTASRSLGSWIWGRSRCFHHHRLHRLFPRCYSTLFLLPASHSCERTHIDCSTRSLGSQGRQQHREEDRFCCCSCCSDLPCHLCPLPPSALRKPKPKRWSR